MSAIKFAANMDKAGIVAAIKSIEGRGSKLDGDIQLTGLSVLAHIEQHKEVSLFCKLYAAMPKGSRANALVAWAKACGMVAVNMDKETSKTIPFTFNKEGKTDLARATKEPWFTFRKEAAPREAFSIEATIAALHDLLAKQIKAGKVDAHDRRVELLLAISPALPEDMGTEGASNDDTTEGTAPVENAA